MKNKGTFSKVLYFLTLVSLTLPIVYLSIVIIIDAVNPSFEIKRPISDYTLMLVECVLGALVIHLPSFLEKKFKFEIPKALYIMFLIFLYCAIVLGELRDFYYRIPHWDSILHTFSSLMSGTFGFLVVDILNREKRASINLSPIFVSIFAFCFSLSIGALWEIYEFSFDSILGLNMQKFRLSNGVVLEGHAALSDTMKDIILDALGALIASVFGYFNLKIESAKK